MVTMSIMPAEQWMDISGMGDDILPEILHGRIFKMHKWSQDTACSSYDT